METPVVLILEPDLEREAEVVDTLRADVDLICDTRDSMGSCTDKGSVEVVGCIKSIELSKLSKR